MGYGIRTLFGGAPDMAAAGLNVGGRILAEYAQYIPNVSPAASLGSTVLVSTNTEQLHLLRTASETLFIRHACLNSPFLSLESIA